MLLRNGDDAFRTLYPLLVTKSKLSSRIKVLLFKYVRTCCGGTKMHITRLQRLSNKVLRYIANIDHLVGNRNLRIPLAKLPKNMYRFTILGSTLTRHVTAASDVKFLYDQLHRKTTITLNWVVSLYGLFVFYTKLNKN